MVRETNALPNWDWLKTQDCRSKWTLVLYFSIHPLPLIEFTVAEGLQPVSAEVGYTRHRWPVGPKAETTKTRITPLTVQFHCMWSQREEKSRRRRENTQTLHSPDQTVDSNTKPSFCETTVLITLSSFYVTMFTFSSLYPSKYVDVLQTTLPG